MKNFILLFIVFCAVSVKAQDIIIKRDGSEISGKVEKIGSLDIEYRRSDQSTTGPIYTIAKSDVFMVRYKDGTKDVFNTVTNEPAQKSEIQITPVAPSSPAPVTPQYTQTIESSSYQNPSAGENKFQTNVNETVDSRNWFMHQNFVGYGGSYFSPFGVNVFNYSPSGWGYYLNVRLQFPIEYHAYTISDGSGGLIIVDADGSSPIDMDGYELDTDWKLFYNRRTFLVGASKLLGTDLGRFILPGIYGGLGLTKQTKYYPYWSDYYGDYIVVKDSENSKLGAELELGASFAVDFLHFNSGFAFNTSTTQLDWVFGVGVDLDW